MFPVIEPPVRGAYPRTGLVRLLLFEPSADRGRRDAHWARADPRLPNREHSPARAASGLRLRTQLVQCTRTSAQVHRRERRCAREGERVCRSSLQGQRSEEHTSELQSQSNLVCRLLLEKKKKKKK